MTEKIYRSQFRLPFPLYERLKASADKNHRSVNSELVSLLERSADLLPRSTYAERQKWIRLRLEACIEVIDAEYSRSGDPLYMAAYNLDNEEWRKRVEQRWSDLKSLRNGLQLLLEETLISEQNEAMTTENRMGRVSDFYDFPNQPDRKGEILSELQRLTDEQARLLDELRALL